MSDSLEMAKFGANQSSKMLIVAGVRFMGETAKILNPEKKILMPTLEAECSLDLNCPAPELLEFSKKLTNVFQYEYCCSKLVQKTVVKVRIS